MKKITAVIALSISMQGAFAQSNVTIFGVIDAGVSYISNEGGGKNIKTDDGILAPNLLGVRGSEDLGDGYHANFALVNQFSLSSGAIVGSSLFSRNAFVAIGSERTGNISLGNQYDFMVDSLASKGNDVAMDVTGLYSFRNGPFNKLALPNNLTGAFDWDHLAGSSPITNSVKYVSPSSGGFSAGAMYGFGEVAGAVGANNAVSAGLNYDNGPMGIGAAYTNQKFAKSSTEGATSVQNWGIGAHYKVDTWTFKSLLTTVHNRVNNAGVWMVETGAVHQFASVWQASASYMYMKGNEAVDNNHAHQLSAALHYFASKRTTLYLAAVYQRANEGANAQINGILDSNGASSSASQSILRIGMRTAF